MEQCRWYEKVFAYVFFGGVESGRYRLKKDSKWESVDFPYGHMFNKFTPSQNFYYFTRMGRDMAKIFTINALRQWPSVQAAALAAIEIIVVWYIFSDPPYAMLAQSRVESFANLGEMLTYVMAGTPFLGIMDNIAASQFMVLFQFGAIIQSVASQMLPVLMPLLVAVVGAVLHAAYRGALRFYEYYVKPLPGGVQRGDPVFLVHRKIGGAPLPTLLSSLRAPSLWMLWKRAKRLAPEFELWRARRANPTFFESPSAAPATLRRSTTVLQRRSAHIRRGSLDASRLAMEGALAVDLRGLVIERHAEKKKRETEPPKKAALLNRIWTFPARIMSWLKRQANALFETPARPQLTLCPGRVGIVIGHCPDELRKAFRDDWERRVLVEFENGVTLPLLTEEVALLNRPLEADFGYTAAEVKALEKALEEAGLTRTAFGARVALVDGKVETGRTKTLKEEKTGAGSAKARKKVPLTALKAAHAHQSKLRMEKEYAASKEKAKQKLFEAAKKKSEAAALKPFDRVLTEELEQWGKRRVPVDMGALAATAQAQRGLGAKKSFGHESEAKPGKPRIPGSQANVSGTELSPFAKVLADEREVWEKRLTSAEVAILTCKSGPKVQRPAPARKKSVQKRKSVGFKQGFTFKDMSRMARFGNDAKSSRPSVDSLRRVTIPSTPGRKSPKAAASTPPTTPKSKPRSQSFAQLTADLDGAPDGRRRSSMEHLSHSGRARSAKDVAATTPRPAPLKRKPRRSRSSDTAVGSTPMRSLLARATSEPAGGAGQRRSFLGMALQGAADLLKFAGDGRGSDKGETEGGSGDSAAGGPLGTPRASHRPSQKHGGGAEGVASPSTPSSSRRRQRSVSGDRRRSASAPAAVGGARDSVRSSARGSARSSLRSSVTSVGASVGQQALATRAALAASWARRRGRSAEAAMGRYSSAAVALMAKRPTAVGGKATSGTTVGMGRRRAKAIAVMKAIAVIKDEGARKEEGAGGNSEGSAACAQRQQQQQQQQQHSLDVKTAKKHALLGSHGDAGHLRKVSLTLMPEEEVVRTFSNTILGLRLARAMGTSTFWKELVLGLYRRKPKPRDDDIEAGQVQRVSLLDSMLFRRERGSLRFGGSTGKGESSGNGGLSAEQEKELDDAAARAQAAAALAHTQARMCNIKPVDEGMVQKFAEEARGRAVLEAERRRKRRSFVERNKARAKLVLAQRTLAREQREAALLERRLAAERKEEEDALAAAAARAKRAAAKADAEARVRKVMPNPHEYAVKLKRHEEFAAKLVKAEDLQFELATREEQRLARERRLKSKALFAESKAKVEAALARRAEAERERAQVAAAEEAAAEQAAAADARHLREALGSLQRLATVPRVEVKKAPPSPSTATAAAGDASTQQKALAAVSADMASAAEGRKAKRRDDVVWYILHSALARNLVLAMDFEADTSPIPVHSAYLAKGGHPYKGMLWRHTKDGFLQNKSTGLVLTIEGHQTGRKIDVVCDEWTAAGADDPTQRWLFTKEAEVVNASNGLCLTVRNGSTSNHGEVWCNTRNRSRAQRWSLERYDGTPLDFAGKASGRHAHLLSRAYAGAAGAVRAVGGGGVGGGGAPSAASKSATFPGASQQRLRGTSLDSEEEEEEEEEEEDNDVEERQQQQHQNQRQRQHCPRGSSLDLGAAFSGEATAAAAEREREARHVVAVRMAAKREAAVAQKAKADEVATLKAAELERFNEALDRRRYEARTRRASTDNALGTMVFSPPSSVEEGSMAKSFRVKDASVMDASVHSFPARAPTPPKPKAAEE